MMSMEEEAMADAIESDLMINNPLAYERFVMDRDIENRRQMDV